jgi:hypothetical protein
VFVVVVTGWVGLVPATLRTFLLLYLAAVRSVTFSGVRDLNWCASFDLYDVYYHYFIIY